MSYKTKKRMVNSYVKEDMEIKRKSEYKKSYKEHECAVVKIVCCVSEEMFISGDEEGKVIFWSLEMEVKRQIHLFKTQVNNLVVI